MKTLSCLVLMCCCAFITAAQERVIDKAAFESVVNQSAQHPLRWKAEKYRMTVTTSSKVAGRPQTDWSSKMIFEYGSLTERRSITTSRFGDKSNPTREALRIGDWTYSRSGNEPWTRKEYTPPEPVQQAAANATLISVTNDEYKYQGTGYLKDKLVQIYERTYRRTRDNEKNGTRTESDVKVTYWIDSTGTQVRNEYRSESHGPSFTSETVIITEWEIDPSITFVAPEVS